MGAPRVKDYDTVIVPMREQGFREVFLGQRKWPRLRVSPESRRQLRYIAAYRPSPVCAVTHVAEILGFEPTEEDGRFDARLAEHPREIPQIPFVRGRNTKTVQSPRFLKLDSLLSAATLNELIEPGPKNV